MIIKNSENIVFWWLKIIQEKCTRVQDQSLNGTTNIKHFSIRSLRNTKKNLKIGF